MFYLLRLINALFYRNWIRRKLNYCGRNFRLGYMSQILSPDCFCIGDDFYAGLFSYFGTNIYSKVEIGNKVMFGPRCTIQGGNHDTHFAGYLKDGKESTVLGPIKIEDGAWVGCDVTIISKTVIGEGSIIGAKSLVNRTIPPYTIAAGIPAKIIKSRFSSVGELSEALLNIRSKYTLEEVIALQARHGITYEN